MDSFLSAFLPAFKLHLILGNFYKCVPVSWDEIQEKIFINGTLSRQISIRIWLLLSGSYIIFQASNLFFGQHSLGDELVGSLILAMYTSSFVASAERRPDFTPIEILNRLLSGSGKIKSCHYCPKMNFMPSFSSQIRSHPSKNMSWQPSKSCSS